MSALPMLQDPRSTTPTRAESPSGPPTLAIVPPTASPKRADAPLVSAEAAARAGSAADLEAMVRADAEALARTRQGGFGIPLNRLRLGDPLRWLALGWRDFIRAPGIGLFYGACFVTMGWLLVAVFKAAPAYVLALSAGFMLTGPFVCLGIYQISRQLEHGRPTDLGQSLLAWTERASTMAIFGFVLLVLEMLWARSSLVIFALCFDGMPDFKGSLMALVNPENVEFIVAYTVVGGIFAAMIFSASVVSIPMILDRPTDAITAALTSLRLVLTQPAVMLFWGALITVIVVTAMLPWFAGLLVVGPVIGHASWHAYRAAVGGERPDAPAA